MDEYLVLVYPQAKHDVSRNAIWWADNHSVGQAAHWIEAVESQLDSLSQNPDRFGVAPESGLFEYELRQMPVGLGSRRSIVQFL